MIGVMIAYALFAGIMIVIVVVVFIAAGISAIRRRIRERKETAGPS